MRVVGLASLAPFDKADPYNPINRRISIVVMTKEAEEQALDKLSAPDAIVPPGSALVPGEPIEPAAQ
jgi:chemotaxis protein MotB